MPTAQLARDIRFAVRSLARSPAFTFVAVLSLALGIGANTAIFTIFDQVLLRLLPVKDPGSLVMIATRGAHIGSNSGSNAISYPMYKDYRERNQVFEGVLCRRSAVVNLGVGDSTERIEAELVSGNYFEVLGIRPAAGRVFTARDESAPGANPVVVLNYDYWQRRFAGDRGILGRSVRINYPMTVVGVAARGFEGVSIGYRPNLHIPVTMKEQVTPFWGDLENRRSRWLQVFARLKPGTTREQAEALIRTLYKQIIQAEVQEAYFRNVQAYPREQFLRSYAVVLPGGQGFSGMRNELEKPLKVLMALVGVVLLIACANVSNLLIARAAARQRDMSIRLAIGAGRRRIIQQLLVESFLLAGCGAVAGLFIATWTTRAVLLLAPSEQSRLALSGGLDGRILAFNMAISVAAALLFGLMPALRISRVDIAGTLKDQAGSHSGGRGGRMRRLLVVAQVSMCFLLLMGSGLFVQSLKNLRTVDPGFKAGNLIRFKIDPTLSGYDLERTKQFYRDLQERLQGVPGTQSAALAVVPIMEGDEWDSTVTVEGYRAKDGENMNPHFNYISPGYFQALGIPFVAGADFDERIGTEARKTAIVNETVARSYFGERSPVGWHIGLGAGPQVKLDIEIVGVVQDSKYESLRDDMPRQVYICCRQNDWATEMTCYVRTNLPSDRMFNAIRQEVCGLDPSIPLYDMNTMEDQLDQSLAIECLVAYLSSAFGTLATVLAIVGLYGVTAYSVERRSREIGIRVALGARSSGVVGLILREVAALSGLGIAIGLPIAWWLTQFVRGQLYGVEAHDPLTFCLAALGLLAVGLLSGALPARRASRVDPVEVLRYQ
jgi:predicted permease